MIKYFDLRYRAVAPALKFIKKIFVDPTISRILLHHDIVESCYRSSVMVHRVKGHYTKTKEVLSDKKIQEKV